jgi:hypothetical protein
MKKILPLLAVAALSAGNAFADEPVLYELETLSHLSPDGNWAVSCGDGQFIVRNLTTGEKYVSEVDESAEDYNYDGFLNAGYGNPVSNNGEVVGSTTYSGGAAVWVPEGEGKWIDLPVLGSSNCAHGITPDGSRIVGYSSLPGVTYYERAVYSVPLLWTRNNEGGYDLTQLPYPETDIFGRIPQYIILHSISSDGKTATGQMTDYSGFYHTGILYHEQADGSWAYELIHPELQNHGLEFPAWEEFNGSYPAEEDFISEDGYSKYYEDINAYFAAGDWSQTYPDIVDYMTDEEIAAYNAALSKYQEDYAAYRQKANAFEEVFQQAYALGMPDFEMNTVAMSSNGKYFAAPSPKGGDFYDEFSSGGASEYTPYLFDLETGDYKVFEDASNSVSYVSDNGDVFGAVVMPDYYTRQGFALAAGSDKFVPFDEYLASRDEYAGAWVAETCEMSYIEGFDYDAEDDDYYLWADGVMSGLPTANADASVVAAWVYDYFDEEVPYFSYLIKLTSTNTGVASISTDKTFSIKVNKAGEIVINGDAASVEVYNLQGVKVYSNNAPAATVQTGLGNGLYVVKATSVNGKKAIAKAAISL